jgi:hypothetical protein
MKAWRRAQRGEDLTETASDEPFDLAPAELTLVGEAAPFDVSAPRMGGNTEGRQLATLSAGGTPVNSTSSYAPFREDAAIPAARDDVPRPEPTTEQLVKRMTTAIERCQGAMTSEFSRQFGKLPEKTRLRFLKSVEQLSVKAAALSE